jgi:pimeloyl-ACP methyl ester carboxylesterase
MRKLENFFVTKNYNVINFDYPSRKYPLEVLANDFLRPVINQINSKEIHFVTHSMGGILTRYFLKHFPADNLGKVVMLAPPNHGSKLVDKLEYSSFLKWWLGPAWLQLKEDPKSFVNNLGEVNFPLGVITGNKSFEPVFSKMLNLPNDNLVTVENTKLLNQLDHLILPCNHISILWNKQMLYQTDYFLRNGLFSKIEDI